jgi:hypothetical protein
MKTWGVATNSVYQFGHYLLREAPWYVFALQRLNFFLYARVIKYLLFKSMLSVRFFYKVTVPIYRRLQSKVRTTWIKRNWDELVSEQPIDMAKEAAQALEYANKRNGNPNFNWDEYDSKKLEYSQR